MTLSEEVIQWRGKNNLSLRVAAEKLGVSVNTLVTLEIGKGVTRRIAAKIQWRMQENGRD